jgi:5-hydroxyisourate hydrolase-like protein (transthyretin family)
MRRLLAVATFGLVVAVGIAPASAADLSTKVIVDQDTVTVTGAPVDIRVHVLDANGQPVHGALVRLTVPIVFMGDTKNEIVGEGTTNDAGRAVITYAPAQTGQFTGTVTFWGSHGFKPSETTVALDVQQAVYAYDPPPPGLQAWWARSSLILVPFLVIWSIYLMLLWLVIRVRKAGAPAPASSEIAPTS